MIVLKVGGSCLKNEGDIKRLIEIAVEVVKKGKKPIFVLSAFQGITDELIVQAKRVPKGNFHIEAIEKRHHDLLRNLSTSIRKPTERRISTLIEELKETLRDIQRVEELRPEDEDTVKSFGERLAVEIVTAYLNDAGLMAIPLSDRDAGILTTSRFCDAIILDESVELVREKMSIPEIPVVTGFIGIDKEGRRTTLGRGGSDYTATFIASTFNSEVVLLKDVDGIMTADPKIVPKASIIRYLNYRDAMELAHYGSKVIHEKAIVPAMKSRSPIILRNFFHPRLGTTICDEGEATALSTLRNIAIITLYGEPRSLVGIFSFLILELCKQESYPLLLTKTSRGETCIVVKGDVVEVIEEIFQRMRSDVKVEMEIEKELGLIAVVGIKEMDRYDKIAFTIKHLLKKGINLFSIDYSAKGRNLYIIVKEEHVPLAAQVIHRGLAE